MMRQASMMKMREPEYPHKTGYIVALCVSTLAFVVNLVINAFSIIPLAPVFTSTTGDVSDQFASDIVPAGWTFSIWGLIFLWQLAWHAYAFSTLCRPGISGRLYYSPVLLPASIFVVFTINSGLLVAWLILFDRASAAPVYLIGSEIVILLCPVAGILCLVPSVRALDKNLVALYQNGLQKEAWLVRFIFQNGIGIYITWVAIASLLGLSGLLHYELKVLDYYDASSVSLGILSVEVLLWFVLDIFLWDRYTRYLFIPYVVLVWALGGAVDKNRPVDLSQVAPELAGVANRNPYWLMALLGVCGLFLLIKLVVMIWRHVRSPQPSADALLGSYGNDKAMMIYGNGVTGGKPTMSMSNPMQYMASAPQPIIQHQMAMQPAQMAIQPTHTMMQPSQMAMQPTHTMMQPTQMAMQQSQMAMQPTQMIIQPNQMAMQPTQMMIQPNQMAMQPTQIAMQPQSSYMRPQVVIPAPQIATQPSYQVMSAQAPGMTGLQNIFI